MVENMLVVADDDDDTRVSGTLKGTSTSELFSSALSDSTGFGTVSVAPGATVYTLQIPVTYKYNKKFACMYVQIQISIAEKAHTHQMFRHQASGLLQKMQEV